MPVAPSAAVPDCALSSRPPRLTYGYEPMHLVDSHCHLDLIDMAPFDGRMDAVLEAARSAGIGHILCVCLSLEERGTVLELARSHPMVSASVGVHPNHDEGEEPTVAVLVRHATDPEVVAIGETGLDYFRSEGDLGWQQDRFRTHIRSAREAGKPLIIHTRDAREDTLRILEEEDAGTAGGVMHCFVEDWDTARRALDIGFYISFSGIVTFRSAEALREVARRVPRDRILVETDAPYLAPVPHRGKPNQPAFVAHIAACVADLQGMSVEALTEQTTRNFYTLFPAAAAQRRAAGLPVPG